MIGNKEIIRKNDYMKLTICLALPLGVGILAGIFSGEAMQDYATMVKPALSPPAVVFPVVWTILYLMMGYASYLIYMGNTDAEYKVTALKFYYIQLAANFMWSFFFFNFREYLFAFAWLVMLWFVVFFMMLAYRKVSWTAAYMTVPYLVWLTFAGYLNLGVYVLNKGDAAF